MTEHPNFSADPGVVDADELRAEVRAKYADVAIQPTGDFHFHTGRFVADRCRYAPAEIDALPARAVESFAGVANPFELRRPERGERVVDLGAGAGLDSILAARAVGSEGYVVGVDMTPAMSTKARRAAADAGLTNVEFCEGFIEDLPVTDGWADVVTANGVINLAPDKPAVFAEAFRVLRPGGVLQFADIANGRPVPAEAQRHIDLWTA